MFSTPLVSFVADVVFFFVEVDNIHGDDIFCVLIRSSERRIGTLK